MLRRDPTVIKLAPEDIKEFTKQQNYQLAHGKPSGNQNDDSSKKHASKGSEDSRI